MEHLRRIALPTPFDVGPVNCYCVGDSQLTLLDPGPASSRAYEALTSGLREEGNTITNVEYVCITHPHMDHFGLASRVVDESGATVIAHEDAVDRLADPTSHYQREVEFFTPFLISMGVPEDIVDAVVGIPQNYNNYQEPVEVDWALRDAESVNTGTSMEALHTPGHEPGSICYLSPDADAVFTGDHVLAGISPNPMLTLSPNRTNRRTRSLPNYLTSLRRLQKMGLTVGYGGHGDRIDDLDARIEEIIDHHQDRKERLADIVRENGPLSPYHLLQEVFPDLPTEQVFPGISEIIGALDLLTVEDRIVQNTEEGVRQYDI